MNAIKNTQVCFHNLATLFILIFLTSCGGDGGSGIGTNTPAAISATANTTVQNLTVGTAMASFTPLTADGGTPPYTYSYTGTLPPGLSFDTSTGVVSGTPTATYASANVVFSVRDANNIVASTTSTVSFTVVAVSATADSTAQSLTVGVAMTDFSPLIATGGTPPYTYSYTGTLPAGLSFDTSTGVVTGTPTATYATANVVFSVQDANNVKASTTSTVLFTVGAASPNISAIANTTAQNLTVGVPMDSFSPLIPSGGAVPYTYSYAGTLPAGLSLNTSTGAVTGTPTATYATGSVVFSVQDANNVTASTTSTVLFTVGAASPTISATANTTVQSLTVGVAMTSFSPLTVSGGATPYTFSYTGTLPPGLSCNPSTGAVTGTPTATYATANVVFSVRDANNVVASATSTVSFTVAAAPVNISATANTTPQSLTVGVAMASFSPLTPTGGATPYAYSYTGTLPAGLSFDTSTGVVTGTPTATYATANVVFSVQDANNVVASTTSTVSFTVGAASQNISATANATAQNLTVGIPMSSFSPLIASGGAIPYTYSHTGTLPAGLSFNASTGVVSGTPADTYATANLVFSVSDANNVTASTTSIVSFTVVLVTREVNDTGITASECYQAGGDTLVACSSAGAISLSNAQDGMTGRDANAATNLSTDGKLGFSFTAVPGGCVQDNVTGLMWEVKTTDGGLRDWATTYTNFGDSRLGDASAYPALVNATNLCGFSDWRLPTVDELLSIMDYGVPYPGPTVDATWFPNTVPGKFWSSSPYVSSSAFVWGVYFDGDFGSVGGSSPDFGGHVRLVRGGQ